MTGRTRCSRIAPIRTASRPDITADASPVRQAGSGGHGRPADTRPAADPAGRGSARTRRCSAGEARGRPARAKRSSSTSSSFIPRRQRHSSRPAGSRRLGLPLRPRSARRSTSIFLISAIARAGIEVLRAHVRAVHDGVAAVQPERILELIEPLAGRLVAAVDDPAVRGQQRRGTEEAVAVPPVARAGGRAAGAQDAGGRPVDLLLLLLDLQPLADPAAPGCASAARASPTAYCA